MPASEIDPALASRDFIISDKPIRPLIKYPTSNKRKFVKAWYAYYPRLEYSIHADAAFWFPCRKAHALTRSHISCSNAWQAADKVVVNVAIQHVSRHSGGQGEQGKPGYYY